MAISRVKDLFHLPETVHKIGFVEELSRAVGQPKITAENYVVTPGIVAAFERALGLVHSALRDGRSRAAFLQGSFGSGKSHFMALVSLLLDGDEHAWRIPELHFLREKFPFAGQTKILQLRFHLIGHTGNLESAIFTRYLETVRRLHPKADLPGVFADEKLFSDAQRMLDELGDDKFFAPMNAGKTADDAWGTIGSVDLWSRERFDHATSSSDPRIREELFNALVKTRFGDFADESRQFVDLDEGLAILGRHAKKLGYAAVLLFLDELILWLASRASNLGWFHNEVQKLVKLVEAQESHRDVPFVSFVARQRDLAEMVGRDHEGLQNALVRDSLKWSEGRFDTIRLEDRNLPAIRAFMKWGDEHPRKHDLSSLLLLGTVGEPINPEAWIWYHQNIGHSRCPIVDTMWQTETGGHIITPLPGCTPTVPGSCTLPAFGIDAAIVNENGEELPANQGGLLVIRRPWPGMLRGIHGDRARFIETYWTKVPGMYIAGDGARRDERGYFWIMGRIDDVINVSGHRLGTMEVESALVSHPAIVEAAVVGIPHEIKGTGIAAFVTLAPHFKGPADDSLRKQLMEHVTKEIGAIARPDMIRFTTLLPKTRSGKIMRRLLRDIAAGKESTQDTTTLEDFNALAKLRENEE